MITISKLLSLQKIIKGRLNELKQLRSESSTIEKTYFGKDDLKEKIPQYDVKKIDEKIVQLERFLLDSDFAVKDSNATTKVDMELDIDGLLSSIK